MIAEVKCRRSCSSTLASSISCRLPYTAPYDWESVLSVFRAHQLPHLESVDDLGYERVVSTNNGMGWFRVIEDEKRQALRMSVWNGDEEDLALISGAVRRMFDLDANPNIIREAMSADPYLAKVWERYPGLRVARSWSAFETMLTTILGQLVSVSFGRTLVHELMTATGVKRRHPKTTEPIYLFPTAKRMLTADLSRVRTSEPRRTAIRSLSKLVVSGSFETGQPSSLEEHAHNGPRPRPPRARVPPLYGAVARGLCAPKELRKFLLAVPGVGAWTSEYIAMRGFHDDDAFPATDYGLKQELKRHPEMDVKRVRPWRAYAATALWKSFADSKNEPYESVV